MEETEGDQKRQRLENGVPSESISTGGETEAAMKYRSDTRVEGQPFVRLSKAEKVLICQVCVEIRKPLLPSLTLART